MEEARNPALDADDLIERLLGVARSRLGLDMALLPEREAGPFIGLPVRSPEGVVVGTLCCIGRDPAVPLSEGDSETLATVASCIAEVVAAESPAQRRDRAIVERVTAAIRLERMRIEYQPISELRSARVVGVEALCRFADAPGRPEVWFEEAASVGLGVELELAAIRLALNGLAELDRSMYLSLNVSPATLVDDRLHRMLAAFEPERLVLELTEHDTIAEMEAVSYAVIAYRRLGVRLALDDVGAGFSSFTHVTSLEPDFVKIDRSVVKSLHRDIARQSLTKAIVEVADGVDAIVVAEGVERQPELDALATLGVGQAQGFVLAEPGPLPAPEEVRRRGRTSTAPDQVALAEAERDLAVQRFDLAMTHSPHGMIIVGLDGSFMHVNPAMERMSGYTERELVEMKHLTLVHPEDLDVDTPFVEECFRGERSSFRTEKRFVRADGATVWGDVTTVLVRSDDGQPACFIAQLQETTERKERENELVALAETDPLTGAANRAATIRRLEHLANANRSFAVLFCDVVGFKGVNDRFGHRAGDHVLIAVAERLRSVTRDGDLVARWGGDEFVLVVPDASAGLGALIDRARAAVAHPITFHPGDATATPEVSIGTACFEPASGDSVDDVLHRADEQMYRTRGTDVSARRSDDG